MYQGGDPDFISKSSASTSAPVQQDILAESEGWIQRIDAETIGRASVEIGAGRKVKTDTIDHRVGFVLHAKIGDHIAPGVPLATIHAASDDSARSIEPAVRSAFSISAKPVTAPPVIIDTIV